MNERTEQTDLTGTVSVVTGGGRGIGREMARQLAAAGSRVVVTARSVDQLEETCELIRSEVARRRPSGYDGQAQRRPSGYDGQARRRSSGYDGHACTSVPMDVLDAAGVKAAFRAIESAHGRIDLLVNNAGISGMGGMPWELDVDDWWRTFEVNVRGPFLCAQAVIPGMIERGSGRIINVSSNMAFWPFPEASAYSCSKAALVRLSDNLAMALKPHGISVFCISPGLVKTEMTRNVPDEFAGATWTPIEKPAELCVALASGRADVLSGRFIHASEHDLDHLIARADEIVEQDLQTMKLVPASP